LRPRKAFARKRLNQDPRLSNSNSGGLFAVWYVLLKGLGAC
jgi:hypothetical protein